MVNLCAVFSILSETSVFKQSFLQFYNIHADVIFIDIRLIFQKERFYLNNKYFWDSY